MGFHCPEQQTTPDFLISLTAPTERIAREGFETRVPRTSEKLQARWQASPEYHALIAYIETYDKQFPIGEEALQKFHESRRLQQSDKFRAASRVEKLAYPCCSIAIIKSHMLSDLEASDETESRAIYRCSSVSLLSSLRDLLCESEARLFRLTWLSLDATCSNVGW